MKKALMIIAMVAIVVIAGSMLYYFVFYKPGIEKAEIRLQEQKLELETKEKQDKKKALDDCLSKIEIDHDIAIIQAWDNYNTNWDGECKRLNKPAGSALPNTIADRLEQQRRDDIDRADKLYESAKDDCFKLHQQ